MATVYILYSKFADKFYIGFTTIQVEDRLERHLKKYYQNKFTSTYSDWELFCEIECETNEQARKIEAHIRKMNEVILTSENFKIYLHSKQ